MAELTFPEAEAAHVRETYAKAQVILEYGSGGSTQLAAEMPDKLVMSVESDRDWAIGLQAKIDASTPPSQAIVYYVDIGPTGKWGRPVSDDHWQMFHRYPMAIWDEPFFRHPDLILIDGRFRAACFAAVCLRITQPVRLLFDDYADRPLYHAIERLCPPQKTVGRMAEFELTPGLVTPKNIGFVISLFSWATYASGEKPNYTLPDWMA